MVKRQQLLVVLADGEHARFLHPAEDHALHEVATFDSRSAHLMSSELRTDRPGASSHSDSSVHNAIEPRHDPHTMEKEKFAAFVAGEIDREVDAGNFDALVLAAPAHTMIVLRKHLGMAAQRIVLGEVEKDLVKTPNDALAAHLHPWVLPVHRAA